MRHPPCRRRPFPTRRPFDATAAAAERADRPLHGAHLLVRREAGLRIRRRHDRLGALRRGPPYLLAQLQVPPAARTSLLLGGLCELLDGGRRRPERSGVCRAGPGRGAGPRAERPGLTRARPPLGRRQDRRPVYAGGLLLPHDDPPTAVVAVLRALSSHRRGTRPPRQARKTNEPLRRRAPSR